jgi:hypothetical protein
MSSKYFIWIVHVPMCHWEFSWNFCDFWSIFRASKHFVGFPGTVFALKSNFGKKTKPILLHWAEPEGPTRISAGPASRPAKAHLGPAEPDRPQRPWPPRHGCRGWPWLPRQAAAGIAPYKGAEPRRRAPCFPCASSSPRTPTLPCAATAAEDCRSSHASPRFGAGEHCRSRPSPWRDSLCRAASKELSPTVEEPLERCRRMGGRAGRPRPSARRRITAASHRLPRRVNVVRGSRAWKSMKVKIF